MRKDGFKERYYPAPRLPSAARLETALIQQLVHRGKQPGIQAIDYYYMYCDFNYDTVFLSFPIRTGRMRCLRQVKTDGPSLNPFSSSFDVTLCDALAQCENQRPN